MEIDSGEIPADYVRAKRGPRYTSVHKFSIAQLLPVWIVIDLLDIFQR
jgi:hypothetical protein